MESWASSTRLTPKGLRACKTGMGSSSSRAPDDPIATVHSDWVISG